MYQWGQQHTMPYRRRRPMRRSLTPVQSFKKVLNQAPTSESVTTHELNLSTGTDSVAAGQTSATDAAVPTGSIIKYFEIQYSCANLVSVALFLHMSIQQTRSGQIAIAPNAVGGDPQRNQVHFLKMSQIGKDQNANYIFRFKIPKKFQRVREGDNWKFVWANDQICTDALQVIYKFYR